MTTPVGPFRYAFNPAKVVPSAARIASVFLTTLYSAFAPRKLLAQFRDVVDREARHFR